MRSGLLVTGLVLFFGFGFVAYEYYPGYTACNSFAGQIYQLLGGQDCNTVYAIFYLSVLLIIVGLILTILGAALSEARELPAPTPQVVYVQQSPSPYVPPPQAYVSRPPASGAPTPVSQAPVPSPAAEWICPACGAGNPQTSAYCWLCGKAPLPPPPPPPPPAPQAPAPSPSPAATPSERFCPSCGAGNLKASAFCEACGKPLPPRS